MLFNFKSMLSITSRSCPEPWISSRVQISDSNVFEQETYRPYSIRIAYFYFITISAQDYPDCEGREEHSWPRLGEDLGVPPPSSSAIVAPNRLWSDHHHFLDLWGVWSPARKVIRIKKGRVVKKPFLSVFIAIVAKKWFIPNRRSDLSWFFKNICGQVMS